MSGMKKRENGKRLGNRRLFSMGLFGASVLFLLLVAVFGYVWQDAASVTDFSRKNLPPCAGYLFGTDWMGRDMFVRTVAGLSMSIRLGLLTAAVSAVIAFLLGLSAAVLGRAVDGFVTLLIDLVMGIPHMLLLILISFSCGKGFWGVTLGIALTHWASLARLIRGEVFQLRESPYIRIAGKLGKSRAYLAFHHMAPNLLPQFITGLILMFPHAPRGQHHLSGVRPFAGGTGHWDHFIGEHEISGHGKMVAGAVSGASSDGGGADVPLCGADHMPDGGSGQCP